MDPIAEARATAHRPPIEQMLAPIRSYLHNEGTGGMVLLLCTVVALIWANSPWGDAYVAVWQTPVMIGAGGLVLDKPLLLWINDGLMALFFFVIGLEIKRELLVGELASPREAMLPIAAAVGGMVLPAVLYLALNFDSAASAGWGVPMATDIAFAIGILALLGNRIPWGLKVFLVSLAIVDDLGAVLVIAFFYTSEISLPNLVLGAVFLAALMLANRIGIRHPGVYAMLGIGGVWLAFVLSGVHATIAGVLVAFTIPARPRVGTREFMDKAATLVRRFQQSGRSEGSVLEDPRKDRAARALEIASDLAQTPLQRLERGLHPWVSLVVMPLFALANAGIVVNLDVLGMVLHALPLGIILGLVVGKQAGIMLCVWVLVKSGAASLPANTSWTHVYGVSCLAGVGFTMSLFIAGLAFGDSDLLSLAKLGTLIASVMAGIAGWLVLRRCAPTEGGQPT